MEFPGRLHGTLAGDQSRFTDHLQRLPEQYERVSNHECIHKKGAEGNSLPGEFCIAKREGGGQPELFTVEDYPHRLWVRR